MNRGLAGVTEACFDELDRLTQIDVADADAVRAEVERAKAVEALTGRIIENGKLVLDVAKASVGVGEKVPVPKGLMGK